jgi:3-methyl-2-oxobutanoate hydroxymethyltransferase
MSTTSPSGRRTVADIAKLFADGQRIAMLTAYDYPSAQVLDEAGIPMVLVGDSLGEVMLGLESTVRISMDEMLHHAKAVVRGNRTSLIVADMPFLSYASPDEAIENAGRFMREAGVQAVKVEGGTRTARSMEALVRAGIPVMGHIGWTPQAKYAMGPTRVQGRSREQARSLLGDALAVQEAGAFAVVIELEPDQLAGAITERLRIPTIGIGAGPHCSGQVLVITDLLGIGDFVPRHARRYANLREEMLKAVKAFASDVSTGEFPSTAEASRMDDATLAEVLGRSEMDIAGVDDTLRIPLDRDL